MQKLFIVGLLIFIIAGGAYYLGRQTNSKPSYKACTMEAKICPDGSGVGRVGPNCEFAECPTSKIPKSTPTPIPSSIPVSQECEPCGEQGIHNLDGRQCAWGLECKDRNKCKDGDECIVSSTHFCLRPGQSIKTCL